MPEVAIRHSDRTCWGFGEEFLQNWTHSSFSSAKQLGGHSCNSGKSHGRQGCSTALILQPSGERLCFALTRVIYRHQTSHMCKTEHTHKCSQKQSQLTHHRYHSVIWKIYNPSCVLKHKNSFQCLMLCLHRNVPDQLTAYWSCKSSVTLKQHLLHTEAWSKKSSILDMQYHPYSALPSLERLPSSLLFTYNRGQKPQLGWRSPSVEHQGRSSSSPSSSKEGLRAWEQVSGSQD